MGGIELESLRCERPRQEELSADRMSAQIEATKKLVQAASKQLDMNALDRDGVESKRPLSIRRFDAFFSIPETNAIMVITSVGLPNEISRSGLLVYISRKSPKGIDQIVRLHTAKSTKAVGKNEALWLSSYSPEQLESLANIISEAEPINKAMYDERNIIREI